ncbi:MAG: DUF2207 domain-containing protein, partial [Gemmatimonadota bacterium]
VAAQRSLAIDRFDSRITVFKDGQIDVTETITATFTGSWNGIYRKVPIDYRTPQGFNWSIHVDFLGATDDQGTPLRTELQRESHYLKFKVWVASAKDVTRTIVLHYRASNALRYFEDHDELYWNATGDEWDVALGQVSAEVTLPEEVQGIRSTAFNGAYGATAKEAVIRTEGNVLRFTMPRLLEFREGLTVVVGWDTGQIARPTVAGKVLAFFKDNWPVAIPIAILLGMLLLWYTRGRDPSRLPITVQYQPPAGMTPAEAGTITDESVDMRDITASLIDLAVRGFLKIEEHEGTKFLGLIGGGTEYSFVRVKPVTTWSALALHEQRLLQGFFKGGAERVDLSDLTNEFYGELPGIKNAVMKRLVDKRYYLARPDTVRNIWRGAGVVSGFGIGVFGAVVGVKLGLTPVPFVVGGILTAVIILVIGHLMPARTVHGTRALEQALGYAEFLRRVDSDRFARVVKTPEMFEQGLGYAMAFGVEQQWSKAFATIYQTPPNWYVGSHINGFNAMLLSTNLASMTHRANTAMTSQPRSSSGSGFSGGGSSGGGGGGGGGGGF